MRCKHLRQIALQQGHIVPLLEKPSHVDLISMFHLLMKSKGYFSGMHFAPLIDQLRVGGGALGLLIAIPIILIILLVALLI